MLTRLHLYQSNRPVGELRHWSREGYLELSPPYQRGDVWGDVRRVNFIRSILLGVPIASIIINDRFGADWSDDVKYAIIDGKQRCTTLLMFFDGRLRIPSDWLNPTWLAPGKHNERVSWNELSIVGQRMFSNLPIPFSEGKLPSIEMEREVFELVNYGGVPQGCSDS